MKHQFNLLVAIGALNLLACSDDSGGAGAGTGGAGGSNDTGGAAGSVSSGGTPASSGGSAGASNPGGGGSAGMVPASGGAAGQASGMGGGSSSGGTSNTGGTASGGASAGGANTAGAGGAAGSAGAAGAAGSGGGGASGFALTSSVVMDGAMIPKEYRCNKPSPPLAWTGGPSGAQSYAIVFKDVTNPQRIVMHWVIYDMPSSAMALPMNVPSGAMITSPVSAKQGPNYSGMPVYAGPCAPSGTNTYKFTLYAIDVASLPGVSASSTATQIETALEGSHKLATTTLNITSSP